MHSIYTPGLVWSVSETGGFSGGEVGYSFKEQFSFTDTLHIDSVKYLELRSQNTTHYLREDTAEQRVYYYCPASDTEFVLIDFNAAPGDTLVVQQGCDSSGFLIAIDAQSVITLDNGDTRLALHVSKLSFSGDLELSFEWIDGLGSTEGLDYFNAVDGLVVRHLYCIERVSEEDVVNYYGHCDHTPWGITTRAHMSAHTSWPNPVSRSLYMSTEGPQTPAVQVIDAMGHTCMVSLTQTQGLIEIDVSALPDGVYSLLLNTNERASFTRFIKVSSGR